MKWTIGRQMSVGYLLLIGVILLVALLSRRTTSSVESDVQALNASAEQIALALRVDAGVNAKAAALQALVFLEDESQGVRLDDTRRDQRPSREDAHRLQRLAGYLGHR